MMYTGLRAPSSVYETWISTFSDADVFARFLYLWGLVMTIIATFIKRKDKLYNKTIVDYWGIGYAVDIYD